MTDHDRHATPEDLILRFYGEAREVSVERHLAVCASCAHEYETLTRVLALVDRADELSPVEAPGPGFERAVWARLEPQLPARRESWVVRLLQGTPRWAFAGAVATLLIGAFIAGRMTTPPAPAPMASADPALAERVLVVAVVDHLDRSQMVLMEVLNADVESAGDLSNEQSLARELVTANRLYRQTAVQAGDGGTSEILDELERVLLEIANTPQSATRDELDVLRARIASRGLLFKVRVVHSQMLERERQRVIPGSQS